MSLQTAPSPPCCLRCAPLARLCSPPPPPPRQDFPHISEFPSGSGSRSPGPSNPTSSGDWDSSYPSAECGVSTCRWAPLPMVGAVGARSMRMGGRWKGQGGCCGSLSPCRRASWAPGARRLQERECNKAGTHRDSAVWGQACGGH